MCADSATQTVVQLVVQMPVTSSVVVMRSRSWRFMFDPRGERAHEVTPDPALPRRNVVLTARNVLVRATKMATMYGESGKLIPTA